MDRAEKTKRPHVVIVGAGFGGTYTARFLQRYVKRGDIALTIISRENYFLFTPLLHEVATGSLTPGSVTEPLREIFDGTSVRILCASVQAINREKRRISVSGYGVMTYDYLVIATGSESVTHDTPGVGTTTLHLKTLEHAMQIRSQVIGAFEEAVVAEEKDLHFVVAGGGATGVEFVAELAEFADRMQERYFADGSTVSATVTLIESHRQLLHNLDPHVQRIAKRRLLRKGVTLRLGERIASVREGEVELADGDVLPASLVIWCTGIAPNVPDDAHLPPVDDFLAVDGHTFALGDVAIVIDQEGNRVPRLAQAATKEARVVAKNVMARIHGRPLTPFVYEHTGTLLSLGQWYAVGKIFGVVICGRMAWWLWRTVYLFKFLSHRKRLRIAFEWTINLFYPRDITNF